MDASTVLALRTRIASVRLALAVLTCVVLTACGRAPIETIPSGPVLLAFVTWNMDAGRGDLPRLVADLEAGRLGPGSASDVVLLLQEAVEGGPHDVRTTAEAKGWSIFFVRVREDEGRPRGNAILSSRPLLDPRAIPLPQQRQPRAAAAAVIDVGGQRVFVVSAHLENRMSWWKGALSGDTARRRQAEALVQALPADEPGIVGGDLNTWLGLNEPAWRTLARRFVDTPEPTRTPTFKDRLILDHLFFDLPDEWRAYARVVPDTYGSDHHPVYAAITRRPTTPVVRRAAYRPPVYAVRFETTGLSASSRAPTH